MKPNFIKKCWAEYLELIQKLLPKPIKDKLVNKKIWVPIILITLGELIVIVSIYIYFKL